MSSHSASVQRRPRSVCAIVQARKFFTTMSTVPLRSFTNSSSGPRDLACHNEKWLL